jgi:hypothetical protein
VACAVSNSRVTVLGRRLLVDMELTGEAEDTPCECSVGSVDACPNGAGAVVSRRVPGGTGEEGDIENLRAGA